jgi:hypothetical protein
MLNLASIVILSIANMAYAAFIYLSLHGWLVVHEPSGMQLLMHLVVTAPLVIITTLWLLYLSVKKGCSKLFWKVNLVGILVPIMSLQTGVTYYHYDKIGLTASIFVGSSLFILLLLKFKKIYRANKAIKRMDF